MVGLIAALAGMLMLSNAVGAAQPSQAQPGRIYKWVDEKGVTHYGQAIPPEYRNREAAEMNRRGVTLKRIDGVATPAQRKAAEDRALRAKEEQKRLYEQRRRDVALMHTYTSAREIEEARDRNLTLPQQAIRGLEPRMKQAQERLNSTLAQAYELKRSGTPVPDYLADDISSQKLEVDAMRADVGRHRSQIEAIRTRFDADRQRYLELTQMTRASVASQ
jgi:hypothetical protein